MTYAFFKENSLVLSDDMIDQLWDGAEGEQGLKAELARVPETPEEAVKLQEIAALFSLVFPDAIRREVA